MPAAPDATATARTKTAQDAAVENADGAPSAGEKMKSSILIGLFGCSIAATVATFLSSRAEIPLNLGISCAIFTGLVTGALLVQQFSPESFKRIMIPSSIATVVAIAAIMVLMPPSQPATPTWTGTDLKLTSTSVTLSWDDTSEVAEYRLFRVNPNGSTTTFEHLLETRLNDTQLAPGSEYIYYLVAIDGSGAESGRGPRRMIRTLEVSPQVAAPTGLKTRNITFDEVDLAWSAPDPAPAGYVVFRDGQPIGESPTPQFTDTADTGLAASTTYQYMVRAKDAAGRESADSLPLSVGTPSACGVDCSSIQAPDAVRLPKVTATGPTAVTVTWRAPSNADVARVTGYRIYRDSAQVAQVGVDKLSWSEAQLTPDTTYKYCVKALNVAGKESLTCTQRSVTTPKATAVTCTSPSGSQTLAATPPVVAGQNVTLTGTSWSGGTDTQIKLFVDGHELSASAYLDVASCGFTKTLAVGPDGLTGADGSAVPFAAGDHQVRAAKVESNGHLGDSKEITVTVQPASVG